MSQQEKAQEFRKLHSGESILFLPGIWDAFSARIAEQAGCKAVALASACVSWANGVRDNENLTCAQLCDAVRNVVAAVQVPVSCDIEKGYGDTAEEVGETVSMVIEAGAVGINIEDSIDGGQRAIGDMQTRIEAARDAAEKAGIDLFINARIDAWLLGKSGDAVYQDSIDRAKAWKEAGADCIFVPGVGDKELISKLVSDIEGPINIIVVGPDMIGLDDLHALGVARVSSGPRLMQAMTGALSGAVSSVLNDRDFRFLDSAPAFGEVEELF